MNILQDMKKNCQQTNELGSLSLQDYLNCDLNFLMLCENVRIKLQRKKWKLRKDVPMICNEFSIGYDHWSIAVIHDVKYLDIKSSSQGAFINKTDVIILPSPIHKNENDFNMLWRLEFWNSSLWKFAGKNQSLFAAWNTFQKSFILSQRQMASFSFIEVGVIQL